MPRVFIPAQLLDSERVTLDRATSRHLVKVLRLQSGAQVRSSTAVAQKSKDAFCVRVGPVSNWPSGSAIACLCRW